MIGPNPFFPMPGLQPFSGAPNSIQPSGLANNPGPQPQPASFPPMPMTMPTAVPPMEQNQIPNPSSFSPLFPLSGGLGTAHPQMPSFSPPPMAGMQQQAQHPNLGMLGNAIMQNAGRNFRQR